ncbi:O-antigen ligase family protein [candidate division KSB1 bacterium]|nr:O-antigen ligase family protein [candidate division KSB1 bacterium]
MEKTENILFNRIIILLFSLMMLSVAFGFSPALIETALLPKLLLLQAGLLCIWPLLLFRFIKNRAAVDPAILKKAVTAALLLYLQISVISSGFAVNRSESLYETAKLFTFILFFFTVLLLYSPDFILYTTVTLTTAGFLLAAIGTLQFFGLAFRNLPGYYYPYATLANKNMLATALLMLIPFAIAGLLFNKGKFRFFATLSFFIMLFCLILTRTRAAWLGLIFASVAALVLVLHLNGVEKLSNQINKNRLGVVILTVLLFITLSAGQFALKYDPHLQGTEPTIAGRVLSVMDKDSGSIKIRLQLWGKTLAMIRDFPLLGVGPGNWKIAFPDYGLEGTKAETGFIHVQRPHNDYLWILAETGIPGFICFTLIILITLAYIFKTKKRDWLTKENILLPFLLMGITGYLVNSFFSFPRERIFLSLLFYFYLAMVTGIYHSTVKPKTGGIALVIPVFIFFYILLAGSLILSLKRVHSEKMVKLALYDKVSYNWDGVICNITGAVSPFYTLDPTATPIHWYRGVAFFSKGDNDAALNDFILADKYHPNHVHVLNNLGTCFEVKKDHERAVIYYKKALAISPVFYESAINLGAAYFNSGNYDLALRTFEQLSGRCKDPRVTKYLSITREKLKSLGERGKNK